MSKLYFLKSGTDKIQIVGEDNPLPVNATVSGAGDGSIVDGAAPTIKATVKDYVNSNPLTVVLTDVNGDPYVASGAVTVPPATATRSIVGDSATAVSLIAANSGRKGLVITNDSSARVFIGYGTVDPTTSSYTFVIYSGQTWEMTAANLFTGQLKGIWETDPNDGAARITELTA